MILGRCPTCGAHSDGLYVRAQKEGGARVWVRITEGTYCKACRLIVSEDRRRTIPATKGSG